MVFFSGIGLFDICEQLLLSNAYLTAPYLTVCSALVYLIAPKSAFVHAWRCPLSKFFNFAASYLVFIAVLYAQYEIDYTSPHRGPPATGDCMVIHLPVL